MNTVPCQAACRWRATTLATRWHLHLIRVSVRNVRSRWRCATHSIADGGAKFNDAEDVSQVAPVVGAEYVIVSPSPYDTLPNVES
jgi:hypothetical protein